MFQKLSDYTNEKMVRISIEGKKSEETKPSPYEKSCDKFEQRAKEAKDMLELYLSSPKRHGIFKYVEVDERALGYEAAKRNAETIGQAFVSLCVVNPDGKSKFNVEAPDYLKTEYIAPVLEVLQSLKPLKKNVVEVLGDREIKKLNQELLQNFYKTLENISPKILFRDSLVNYYLQKELSPLLTISFEDGNYLVGDYAHNKAIFTTDYLLKPLECLSDIKIKEDNNIKDRLNIIAGLLAKVYWNVFNATSYDYLLIEVPEIFTKELDKKSIEGYYRNTIEALGKKNTLKYLEYKEKNISHKDFKGWISRQQIKIQLPEQTEAWSDIFNALSDNFPDTDTTFLNMVYALFLPNNFASSLDQTSIIVNFLNKNILNCKGHKIAFKTKNKNKETIKSFEKQLTKKMSPDSQWKIENFTNGEGLFIMNN